MKTKHADEIMSAKIFVIGENETLFSAYSTMRERQIRHLPVVNLTGEITGMLSDRDVMRASYSQIVYDQSGFFEDLSISPGLMVKEYMSFPVVSVGASTSVQDVVEKMLKQKISSLLVTNESNNEKPRVSQVVGIVTTDDLLGFLLKIFRDNPDYLQMSLRSILNSPLLSKLSQTVSDMGI